MKLFEYILKFGFMFGLSIVLMLYGGPAFFKKVQNDETNVKSSDGLLELKLHNVFNSNDYTQFLIITQSNDSLIKNYYVPEKEYRSIEDFLIKNQLIQGEELLKSLPIVLKKNDLLDYEDIKYRLNKNNIEFLSINNQLLIGNKITKLGKAIYYILGGLISVVGFLGFLLSSMTLIDCIKTYQQTGAFPSLPNSINSKIEGLQYIFRGFKSKKVN